MVRICTELDYDLLVSTQLHDFVDLNTALVVRDKDSEYSAPPVLLAYQQKTSRCLETHALFIRKLLQAKASLECRDSHGADYRHFVVRQMFVLA